MLSFSQPLFPPTKVGTDGQRPRTPFLSPLLRPVSNSCFTSRRPRFVDGFPRHSFIYASAGDVSPDANKVTESGEMTEGEAGSAHDDSPANNIREGADVNSDETSIASNQREPVEDGVTLPDVGAEELRVESSWLEIEIRSWLDDEWRSAEAWTAHRGIAHRTAQLYQRLRAERVNDLSTLLLGLGSGLEGGTNSADFSNAYVGPWTIANKAAELVLARFHPERAAQIPGENQSSEENKPWSYLEETLRDLEHAQRVVENEESSAPREKDTGPHRPVSPNLADKFERYRFLQMVLEGTASKRVSRLVCTVTFSIVKDQDHVFITFDLETNTATPISGVVLFPFRFFLLRVCVPQLNSW